MVTPEQKHRDDQQLLSAVKTATELLRVSGVGRVTRFMQQDNQLLRISVSIVDECLGVDKSADWRE